MKIARSQLKQLIKEEMTRITEEIEDRKAFDASETEFKGDMTKTVMYQDTSGQWFKWAKNASNAHRPNAESITNNDKDKAQPGSVLFPNDGPRTEVKDNSRTGTSQAQRRRREDILGNPNYGNDD